MTFVIALVLHGLMVLRAACAPVRTTVGSNGARRMWTPARSIGHDQGDDHLLERPRNTGRDPRGGPGCRDIHRARAQSRGGDRKSTRLNYSHLVISYSVFC